MCASDEPSFNAETDAVDSGFRVWDASIALVKYLEHTGHRDVVGKRVLELGAGTGVVGLATALLGASRYSITYLYPVLELL